MERLGHRKPRGICVAGRNAAVLGIMVEERLVVSMGLITDMDIALHPKFA